MYNLANHCDRMGLYQKCGVGQMRLWWQCVFVLSGSAQTCRQSP